MFKSLSRSFFLALFGSTLLLTACGSEELGEPITRDYETLIGEFTSLGSVKVNPIVTHLFETSDGEILYAYSDRYDLDEYSIPMEAYGVLSSYEGYDKSFFEIKRLTEADEVIDEEEVVTEVEYRNSSFGAMTTIYSDWEVNENSPGWVTFTLPTPTPSEEEVVVDQEPLTPDSIDWVLFTDVLTSTPEDTEAVRAEDIRTYVYVNYTDLASIEGELTHVGPDQVLGIRYKTAVGDIFVFVPRGNDLLEMSYHYMYMDDALRIQHSNLFSSTLNKFRFIPDDDSEIEEATEDVGEPIDTDESESSATQVSITKFATFSSSSFGFSMSYPSSWYYSGGSTGYAFDDEAIEDPNAESILQLKFNFTTTEGIERGGPNISVTKKIESRYYTLVGPAEYETVMETMLNSIQTINE